MRNPDWQLLQPYFDAQWYLHAYPDVARAGVDAWQHYCQFGWREQRHCFASAALNLEQQLWAMPERPEQLEQASVVKQLHSLLTNPSNPAEALLAAWVLARWYASWSDWQRANDLLQPCFADHSDTSQAQLLCLLVGSQGPLCLYFASLVQLIRSEPAAPASAARLERCRAWLQSDVWHDEMTRALAQSMIPDQHGASDPQHWLAAINPQLQRAKLRPVQIDSGARTLFDGLQAPSTETNTIDQRWRARLRQMGNLVSVIIPCFNAEHTIATAIASLQQQSWGNLEIIVVDDASTDQSLSILRQLQASEPRLKVLALSENQGAYGARNAGLALSKGRFITTHDSDDWSHPDKISLQVEALLSNRKAVASVSSWLRLSDDLLASRWRMEDGWLYRNVSSLLFRRTVHQQLGFWDLVAVNADTEFYYRILKQFGERAIVAVAEQHPLAFGRSSEASLSQTSATHLRTQFVGVRRDYHEAAQRWHAQASSLYLAQAPKQRPFAVPLEICRGSAAQRRHNTQLWIAASGLFDAAWYVSRYSDVAAAGVDALAHYVSHGASEGRDPCSSFSTSAYAYQHQLSGEHALVSYLADCQQRKLAPNDLHALLDSAHISHQPSLANSAKPTMMVVAHLGGQQAFGAERSLLQMLPLLAELFELLVLLPDALAADYIEQVRQHSRDIYVIPYRWWRADRELDQAVVELFTALLHKHQVREVYVNTMVLWEPMVAARLAGCRSSIHVRELIEQDPWLLELFNCTAEQAIAHVKEHADRILVNSRATAQAYAGVENLTVIENRVDERLFAVAERDFSTSQRPLVVTLVSSNSAKKGLEDFIAVARMVAASGTVMRFRLVGPVPSAWQDQLAPLDNIEQLGYLEQVEAIYSDTDVVVNLSHFAESFGRTILEAMAAGRVPVAYDFGAVAELIDADTGVLVPYRAYQQVAEVLLQLAEQRTRLSHYASHARARARNNSYQQIKLKVEQVFSE